MPMPPSYSAEPYGLLWNLRGLASSLENRGDAAEASTVRETIQAIEDIAKVVQECDDRIENQAATLESAMNRIAELEGRQKPDNDPRLCPRDPAPTPEQIDSARRIATQMRSIDVALRRIRELEAALEDLGIDPSTITQQNPPET